MDDRIHLVDAFVRSLYERLDETAQAIVSDGWPEAMARKGLELHARTWSVDHIVRAMEAELGGFGGLRALDDGPRAHQTHRRHAYHVTAPERVVHIWPALPGAGLAPVLMGWVLGVTQIVRPSSRGQSFARLLKTRSKEVMGEGALELLFGAPASEWREVDAIIVSGSDETIATLRDFLGEPPHRGHPMLISYGHRVSATLIVDGGSRDEATLGHELVMRCARDIVLWHQQGCFSSRAVIFCGAPERRAVFAQRLGEAIELCEELLDAQRLGHDQMARRAQRRGVAEMMGDLHGEGLGWVQPSGDSWRGEDLGPHVVSLHGIDDLSELAQVIDVPPHQLQGCALHAPRHAKRSFAAELARLGFTRVCAPGMLQSPPASWYHDGQPNLLDMLRVTTIELD